MEPGRNLSHYRLVEKIGEGGMGVVWKAVDTTLDREVAIKVLPAAFAADAERLARFEREAKLLAALNHPNIASIYGLHEVHEGTDLKSVPIRFLAMELVDGEDLADLLARGPLSLDGTLKVAQQVAMALEAAHQAGVVHRDLKPANIRVTPAGVVKVLDLGLAKAMTPDAASGGNLSLSPTMTSAGSVAGMILGTAAYMSPEQARGSEVDARTDVWAWGCVLFEMLTGRQLFRGATVSDSIAAILKTEPPWELLPDDAPWFLKRLLQRCLVKDPADRLHSMADVRIELQDPSTGPLPVKDAMAEARAGRMPRWGAVTIGALALTVVGLLAMWLGATGRTSSSGAPARLTVSQQTFYAGEEQNPTLSRDGSFLAYSAVVEGDLRDVVLERVGGRHPINLTGTSDSDDAMPAFSADGRSIAFRSSRDGGGIFVMGATGEAVRRLTDEGFDPAWSPDGKQIAYGSEGIFNPLTRSAVSTLHIVDVETGESRKVYDGDAVQPSWSPHGHRIACWDGYKTRVGTGQRDIYTLRPDGTDRIDITDDAPVDWNPVWSADGRYLYFVSDRGGSMNIWRVPIDERTGRVQGELEPIPAPASWVGWISVAADGRVAYMSADVRRNLQRLPLDPATLDVSGPPESVTRGAIIVLGYDISPDGETIVFRSGGIQEDLYLVRADGSELRKLTDDPHRDRGPSWVGNGTAVVFYSSRGGSYRIWTIRKDGSRARPLTREGVQLWYPTTSPDGTKLTAWNSEGTWLFDLGREEPLAREDGLELPPVGEAQGRFFDAIWSPDGRYLGGASVPPNTIASFYDVEAGDYRYIESAVFTGPARTIGWLADGRAVVQDASGLYALHLDTGATTPVARSWALPESNPQLTLAPDAKWIYHHVTSREADIWIAETN